MNIEATCPHCSASFRVSAEKLGKSAKCARCGGSFSLSSTVVRLSRQQGRETNAQEGVQRYNQPQPLSRVGRFQIKARLGAGAFGRCIEHSTRS